MEYVFEPQLCTSEVVDGYLAIENRTSQYDFLPHHKTILQDLGSVSSNRSLATLMSRRAEG